MTDQADPTPGGSRATRLRLARRIDWRFFLSDPSLGIVTLAGPSDAGLRAALESVASALVDADADADVEIDVGVLTRGASASDVQRVTGRVRPGGHVIAESRGLLGWRPSRSASMPARRIAGTLRDAGFTDVVAVIAWPAHGRTIAFLPAGDRRALSWWLSRKLPGALWRLAAPATRVVVRLDLLASLAPAVVVIATRPAEPVATRSVEPVEPVADRAGWLAERLTTSSFVALTPRFGASSHVVALGDVATGRDGGPRVVLKVARLDDDDDAIRREAEALARVEPGLGAAGLAPRPLDVRWDSAPPYLVETGVHGTPLDPGAVRRDVHGAARSLAVLVAALPTSELDRRPAELVAPALETVRGATVAPDLAALVTATDRLLASVADRSVPAVLEHGDLAHPNLVVTGSGALGAVDWERARPDGLPLHDLAMGLAYIAAAARRATGPDDQAAAFRSALTGPDRWAGDLVDAELARLGVAPDLRTTLLVAPWVRTAAWLAERTDPSTWLADRSIAHWRAMLAASPDDA